MKIKVGVIDKNYQSSFFKCIVHFALIFGSSMFTINSSLLVFFPEPKEDAVELAPRWRQPISEGTSYPYVYGST